MDQINFDEAIHSDLIEEISYRDLNGISCDDISQNCLFEDVHYRSVGAILDQHSFDYANIHSWEMSPSEYIPMPQYNKSQAEPTIVNSEASLAKPLTVAVTGTKIRSQPIVPAQPDYLLPTHIRCALDIESILQRISYFLDESCDVSFEQDDASLTKVCSFCGMCMTCRLNAMRM